MRSQASERLHVEVRRQVELSCVDALEVGARSPGEGRKGEGGLSGDAKTRGEWVADSSGTLPRGELGKEH